MKREHLRTLLRIVINILTALATTLGVQSCL